MGKFAVEIKWGIIYSALVLAWAIFEKVCGLYDESIRYYALYTNLFAFLSIAVYAMAIKEKKEKFFDGNMDWKQGLVSGVYLTVVITILSPICQILIHKVIAPEFLPNLINYKVSNGYLSPSDAHAYFNLESYIYQSSSFALSMGVVLSAILAYFIRTKKQQSQ